MKSRVNHQEYVCQQIIDEIDKCVNANYIIFLIALARHAGWGKKRIANFINTLNEVMDEYHQNSVDGVFDYMADRELQAIGIDKENLFPKSLPLAKRLKKKEEISFSEAKKARDKMNEFLRRFTND